jgi:hypothetical protein
MAMYGAAGVAGLGAAAYGAKRLLGSNAVATEPVEQRVSELTAEQNAELAKAQQYLKQIGEIVAQNPTDDKLKSFHEQMTKAILMVAAQDQTPQDRLVHQNELENLMEEGKIEFSKTGTGIPDYYKIIGAGIGALVLIGIGSWTGLVSVGPTLATIGNYLGSATAGISGLLNSGAGLTLSGIKSVYAYLPARPSWLGGGETARRRRVKNRSNKRIATPSLRRRRSAARRG